MIEEIYKCPMCNVSHNSPNNNPDKENNSGNKILCPSCLNELLNKEKNLIFPNELNDNNSLKASKISQKEKQEKEEENDEIVHKSINDSIIEEIKKQSKNKVIIEEMKNKVKNKSFLNSNSSYQNKSCTCNKPETKSNLKNHTNMKSNNYYIKKTVKDNKLLDLKNLGDNPPPTSIRLCEVHSLPVNIICINEKKKICSQCALNKNHLNHKIISEKELNEYIEELENIYNNIDISKKKYNNFDNNFSVLENINDIFLETEKNLIKLKNNIINNINKQFITILNFINLRRKEIFEKYQNNGIDISSLITSTDSWLQIVSNKISKSKANNQNKNSGGDNIFIFLEKENNNNDDIFNLINSGKQLNERYNFVKEINIVIKNLLDYKNKGIIIKQNDEIISPINNNNKIIYIEENSEIIKALGLSTYENLMSQSELSNIVNKDRISIDKQKIYFRKTMGEIDRDNYSTTQKKNNSKIKNNDSLVRKSRVPQEGNSKATNETTFPLLNDVDKIKKFTKLLRTKTADNMIKIRKRMKNNESIEVSNYNDNNININFNGHIFNYNSDPNYSISIQDKSKINNDNKINNVFDLLTPKQGLNPNQPKKDQNAEKQKIIRCFSYNEGEKKTQKINTAKNKLNSSKKIKAINNTATNAIRKDIEESFRNFDFFYKKNNESNISKKSKINYKTLLNKELQKYVNYQLNKFKPNFSRINLRNNGIKLICLFFKNNRNKKYKEIKLKGCNLCDKDFELFSKSLIANNISIPKINASENKLSDNSAFAILDFINEYNLGNNNCNEAQNLFFLNNPFSKGIKEKIKEFVNIKREQDYDINIQI